MVQKTNETNNAWHVNSRPYMQMKLAQEGKKSKRKTRNILFPTSDCGNSFSAHLLIGKQPSSKEWAEA